MLKYFHNQIYDCYLHNGLVLHKPGDIEITPQNLNKSGVICSVRAIL